MRNGHEAVRETSAPPIQVSGGIVSGHDGIGTGALAALLATGMAVPEACRALWASGDAGTREVAIEAMSTWVVETTKARWGDHHGRIPIHVLNAACVEDQEFADGAFRKVNWQRETGLAVLPEEGKVLPNGLRVCGMLDISRCIEFRTFPERLEVTGVLDMEECLAWDGQIPEGVVVEGELRTPVHPEGISLKGWRERHPFGERYGKDFLAAKRQEGMSVPEACRLLVRSEDLDARNLARWTMSDWAVEQAPDLKTVLDELCKDGGAPFIDSIVRRMGGLKWAIRGDFDLSGRPWLTILPANMDVSGSLSLAGCVNLEMLPWGLRVGGDLDLRGCPVWNGIFPGGASIGGRILTDADPEGVRLVPVWPYRA
jgi:hypothetical protein